MITIKVTINNKPITLEIDDPNNAAEVYLVTLESTGNDYNVTNQIVNAVQAADFETIG
jgi:hypothetical protein